jgi:isopentenyl diphosphate isomerase/L-lactate dehydrogenase-like FMN-dependent dehydrogenase
LQIARTAAEKALDRAQEAGDFSTVREIETALRELDQFDMTSTTLGQTSVANPDILNRVDAIVGFEQ